MSVTTKLRVREHPARSEWQSFDNFLTQLSRMPPQALTRDLFAILFDFGCVLQDLAESSFLSDKEQAFIKDKFEQAETMIRDVLNR